MHCMVADILEEDMYSGHSAPGPGKGAVRTQVGVGENQAGLSEGLAEKGFEMIPEEVAGGLGTGGISEQLTRRLRTERGEGSPPGACDAARALLAEHSSDPGLHRGTAVCLAPALRPGVRAGSPTAHSPPLQGLTVDLGDGHLEVLADSV